MIIYARVKAAGRRRDVLAPVPFEIADSTGSLRELLTALTEAEVNRYNRTQADPQLIFCLTDEEITAQADSGRVSFGRIFSDRKADPCAAIQNTIACWEDGLIRVFMGDLELTDLDAPITIREHQEFTLLRLAFLAGRMW